MSLRHKLSSSCRDIESIIKTRLDVSALTMPSPIKLIVDDKLP